ncbi:dihydrodipicolinate synthase family protein [Megalodesulfovibrio paquesii]
MSAVSAQFRVEGPVFPLPVPFGEDGSLDLDGLAGYVRYLIDAGARTVMTTIGTSRFSLLTEAEMLAVNETAVQAAAGRATVIVTTPPAGPLARAREFVHHAATIGAAAILSVFPDRYYGEEAAYEYTRAVAENSPLPILLHLAPIPNGFGGAPYVPSVALLRRLAALPAVAGMKEESHSPAMSYAYNRQLGQDLCIIGGAGGMRAYLTASLWGQPAYLVGIGNVVPAIELEFFEAVRTGRLDRARAIVFEVEEPFFETACRHGWHLSLKAALAGRGLMPPWERAPMPMPGQTIRDELVHLLPAD